MANIDHEASPTASPLHLFEQAVTDNLEDLLAALKKTR